MSNQPWEPSASLEALRRVLTRGSAVHRIVARRAGLSDHELAALELLARHPCGPAEIAESLDVTRAAATGIVDRLVGNGHAERRPHPYDRRRTDVVVTASGQAEARLHLAPMFSALQALDAGFDESDRAVVARYLDGALAALDTVAERDPSPEG